MAALMPMAEAMSPRLAKYRLFRIPGPCRGWSKSVLSPRGSYHRAMTTGIGETKTRDSTADHVMQRCTAGVERPRRRALRHEGRLPIDILWVRPQIPIRNLWGAPDADP